eukprot:6215694-Alexandrium_andersonii.AAC.1
MVRLVTLAENFGCVPVEALARTIIMTPMLLNSFGPDPESTKAWLESVCMQDDMDGEPMDTEGTTDEPVHELHPKDESVKELHDN